MSYQNIPEELRSRQQWVCWRYVTVPNRDKPAKVPYNPRTGHEAKPNDPSTWSTFEVAAWAKGYDGIGYNLSADDPYAFIDIDPYGPNLSERDVEILQNITYTIQSYTEISPSGKGYHIITKAKVGEGRRRGGVEVYSSNRYFTFTGNVWRDSPITDQQELVQKLWEDLAPPSNGFKDYVEASITEDDRTIIDRAENALNGALFKSLWTMNYGAEYPSPSEADFALIDIIGFYTQNREQIKRIFRLSPLAQRNGGKKAKREGLLNSMIDRTQDNRPPTMNIDKLKTHLDEVLAKRQSAEVIPINGSAPVNGYSYEPAIPNIADTPYTVPTGLMGEIAQYIYWSSPRIVPEIALAGAIGLMAGICGRSYNISSTGLNQYILLIAQTGTGKESIADAMAYLMNNVKTQLPLSTMFIGPGQIRSDAALYKYLAKDSASFVSVQSEFGQTLNQMAHVNSSPTMKGLKQAFLDLYSKSGAGKMLRPTIYSQRENTTSAVLSPALTILAESAPGPFYECLDERLIADGLLPRFTLIEYKGKRPDLNEHPITQPSESLVQKMVQLCGHSISINQANGVINIPMDDEAKEMMRSFDKYCTNQINSSALDVIHHIWNRAHLRALKLAGLLAVGNNPFLPVVNANDALWAINISKADITTLLEKFETGEVGTVASDVRQIGEVKRVIKDYLTHSFEKVKTYSSFKEMHAARVVPYAYIQRRLAAVAVFRLDKYNSTIAIQRAIKNLIDMGEISELNKQDSFNRFGTTVRSFCVLEI